MADSGYPWAGALRMIAAAGGGSCCLGSKDSCGQGSFQQLSTTAGGGGGGTHLTLKDWAKLSSGLSANQNLAPAARVCLGPNFPLAPLKL